MPAHSLEQEAMERVRRMYAPFESDRGNAPEKPAEPHTEAQKPEPDKKIPEPEERTEPERPGGMLELLMKDKDRSLIMLLLVIMLRDGADMNMILALVYLLL